MRLRLRLVITMIVLVAVGLAAVDAITLSSLRSSLYGRVDDQLRSTARLITAYVDHSERHGHVVTVIGIDSRVNPELYVELLDRNQSARIVRPSGEQHQIDPPPQLPGVLPTGRYRPTNSEIRTQRAAIAGLPLVNVPSVVRHGPEFRLLASPVTGGTLVVATALTTVDDTLSSLRTIELALSIGLLVVLAALMTLLIRLGLRPLEAMVADADAIAAGDLTRRVQPTRGNGEIARLGRAFNRMLAQIEAAFTQRERSEERLKSFVADASHELRTPLTSIRGYAELLRTHALVDPEARDRALARIEREAGRMGALVGDLSVLASDGVGPDPARQPVDLAAVAEEAVADARTIHPARHIGLDAPAAVIVSADDARLEQMVHNLVGNALTHTPPGTAVDVTVVARGDRALLEVTDRGPGMTDEQAHHAFDRFYRGGEDRWAGGSGLGLFIVANLARTFGGEVSVDTAIGRGSTFRVVLPLSGPQSPAGSEPGGDHLRPTGWSAKGPLRRDGPGGLSRSDG